MTTDHNMQTKIGDAIKNGLCTYCGACVGLCPYNAAYRDRLVVLHACDKDTGACQEVCPREQTDLEDLRNKYFESHDLTPEIGALKGFYIARSSDKKIREKAQHGGTVTSLIALALEEGMIDRAVLTGEEEPLLPEGLEVSSPEEVKRLSKSRFVASPTVAAFNRVAGQKQVKRIGVVATPCQAMALAKMQMSKTPHVRENSKKLKLVIGLFCGWAFSWEGLKKALGRRVDVKSITGMDILPSQYHSVRLFTAEGEIDLSLDDFQFSIRPSCRYCIDMTAEFSDISVGSARLPDGWESARSWNQVIVRTSFGKRLISLAESKGVLEFSDIPPGNLEKLKQASADKKRMALKCLARKSGQPGNLLYVDANDPAIRPFLGNGS